MKETKEKKEKRELTKPNGWVVKDRLYTLRGRHKPLVFTIPSRHTATRPLLYFDEGVGYNRELKYATNQPTPFVDEQKGVSTLGRIVMRNGKLFVEKADQCLQLLLSVYHPWTNERFEEYDEVEEAIDELATLEYSLAAMNAAKSIDIEHAEAILRAELGSDVIAMSSKEIKRDIMLMARRNPHMFLQLANDENVELRNFGAKAVEQNHIKLSPDQRMFTYPNGKKLCAVPYDEHPYNALAAWFKTDEGMEVYKVLAKKVQ